MAPQTPMGNAFGSAAAITRPELKQLMRRRNGPALRHGALWIAAAVATTVLVTVALGSWWLVPALILHGFVLVHHFSIQHECIHYTVFRNRRLNRLVASYCGVVIATAPTWFRYEHCDHHTYTQDPARDPELMVVPQTIPDYIRTVSAVDYWRGLLGGLVKRSLGRFDRAEQRFIPTEEVRRVVVEARLMVVFYLGVIAAMVLFGRYEPLLYWWIPMLVGQPFMRAIRMTEHVGRPLVPDAGENTRSCLVSRPLRLLCWNMNYHSAHHFAPSVPFHALPTLHAKIGDFVHVEPGGYLGAHRKILRQVRDPALRAEAPDAAGRASRYR